MILLHPTAHILLISFDFVLAKLCIVSVDSIFNFYPICCGSSCIRVDLFVLLSVSVMMVVQQLERSIA